MPFVFIPAVSFSGGGVEADHLSLQGLYTNLKKRERERAFDGPSKSLFSFLIYIFLLHLLLVCAYYYSSEREDDADAVDISIIDALAFFF